jgi:putative ABC transport system substrate-binding protein
VGLLTGFVAEAKEVAVIWDTKSAMVSSVVMGFLPKMRELAPDLKVSLHRELTDMDEVKRVFHENEQRVDGIVLLRSSGAKFLGTITPRVPCFIGACNDPGELGVIKNPDAPEGMITGVTYFIPYKKRFDIILSLFPGTKTVALLVQQGHPSGPIEQAGTREECARHGIAYKEVVASNLNELQSKTRSLGKVDLYIITNTALVMDNVINLLPIANASKTPIFSYADKPVKSGAVAGIAADDTKLGGMLAESGVDVIVYGKPVSKVPVMMDPNPMLTINEGMMRSLGLQFPESVLKTATILK